MTTLLRFFHSYRVDLTALLVVIIWGISAPFRLLKHLLAAEACQARSEDAYYGHFVLRLMAGFVLFYTSRVIFKGHMTIFFVTCVAYQEVLRHAV